MINFTNTFERNMSNISVAFNDMTHEQVWSAMKNGLHYLTTTELVKLHSEISRVQIEHSHKNEDGTWPKEVYLGQPK
mgnify:CR=1 FL=1